MPPTQRQRAYRRWALGEHALSCECLHGRIYWLWMTGIYPPVSIDRRDARAILERMQDLTRD